MGRIKSLLIISILLLAVGCRSTELIDLNEEVVLFPIAVMGDLDYQGINNRFVGIKSGENSSQVYIFELDRNRFTKLTNTNSSTVNRDPKWNPINENLILFRSDGEFGNGFWIGTINLSSSKKTAIAIGRSPEWLSDGDLIAYIVDFSQVFTQNITTGQVYLLLSPELDTGDKIIEIAVSPNGQHIAFLVDQLMGDNLIYLAEINNNELVSQYELVVEGLFHDDLDWSANSDFLILQQIEPKMPLRVMAFNLEKHCLTGPLSIADAELLVPSEFVWSDDNSNIFVSGKIDNSQGLLKITVSGETIATWLNSGECN